MAKVYLRHPYDGLPYICAKCSNDWYHSDGTIVECNSAKYKSPGHQLETREDAQARRKHLIETGYGLFGARPNSIYSKYWRNVIKEEEGV